MDEAQISTGDAAKISGLTIRTLQHYDNIGVLPASGRTEGGRRYYTEKDMIKLQHVVFYKGLGFSLDQIKDKLLNSSIDDSHAKALLDQQKIILYNQIYTIQNSIAAVEASQEIIDEGKNPPWTLLTVFMQSLGEVDISKWKDYQFTEEQIDIFSAVLPTLDDVMDFYNSWKKLSIKAAAFQEAEIEVSSPPAQKLAKEWLEMTGKATGGEAENVQAYLEVDSKRDAWNPAERKLIEKAEPYLIKLLTAYQDSE